MLSLLHAFGCFFAQAFPTAAAERPDPAVPAQSAPHAAAEVSTNTPVKAEQPLIHSMLPVGTSVLAKYRGKGKWFPGKVSSAEVVAGQVKYAIAYDDGDVDHSLAGVHVREVPPDVLAAASSPPVKPILKKAAAEESAKLAAEEGPQKSVRFSEDTVKK